MKILRTASLVSNFTGSYIKKEYVNTLPCLIKLGGFNKMGVRNLRIICKLEGLNKQMKMEISPDHITWGVHKNLGRGCKRTWEDKNNKQYQSRKFFSVNLNFLELNRENISRKNFFFVDCTTPHSIRVVARLFEREISKIITSNGCLQK